VLGEKIHRYIFLFGLCALAFGMMMGTVPTSVPQIILMANWLSEGKFLKKWTMLRSNKIFWILSSVFLIHFLGLLYTADLQAGGNDVRTKMPMMFLPMLLMSTAPLSAKEFRFLLYSFLAGCLSNTLWCILYTHILHKNEVVRNASRFMSHIRLGLYLNIAIVVCFYLFRELKPWINKVFLSIGILYFIFCFYALGLASGLINFILLVFIFLCYTIYKQRPILKLSFFVLLAGFVFSIIFYVTKVATTQLKPGPGLQNTIQNKTPWGSSYIHFEKDGQKENGNYVLINIELQEIRRVWNRRVPEDTFSYTPEKNLARYEVLVRYLASKGLNKDSATVSSLSEQDLLNIRNNVFNYRYPEWSFLHRRLYEAINEYDEFINGRHVNGHSITMRLYFWKAAWHVVKLQPVFGVGTGDVQSAMNQAYQSTSSPLNEMWHKRPHNQFLTVAVALGVLGLFIFVFSLIYPAWVFRKNLPALYWTFLFVAIVSFFVEDTLETQAGQTFFAFFNSLFIAQSYWDKEQDRVG